jgi:hypothetical protein
MYVKCTEEITSEYRVSRIRLMSTKLPSLSGKLAAPVQITILAKISHNLLGGFLPL